jgi:hypothetical protein
MREVDRLQQAHERDEMNDDNIIRSQDGVYDRDDHQPDYTSIYSGIMRNRNDEDIQAMKWDDTHDHHGNIDNTLEYQLNCDTIEEKWKIIQDTVQPTVRRIVTSDDLKEQQKQAVLVWLDICGVSKNNEGQFIPSKIREDNDCLNGMIICGTAGTGKSYAIDAMVYELLRRLEEMGSDIIGKSVLVMAPTGKAALQAGGYTLQSKDGLSIGTREERLSDRMKGNALLK